MTGQPTRPKILLAGDPSARPAGLERALSRAGFQLVERQDSVISPLADAILISLSKIDEVRLPELLPPSGDRDAIPPHLVLISSADPDAPAAALAQGAADALVAPIHLPELCARLHARIREHRQSGRMSDQPDVSVDPAGMVSASNGRDAGSVPTPSPDQEAEALEVRVQEEFERARRYSLSFSLILLGIDELRGLEERLGVEAAHRLRHEVGRTLRRELRLPDLVVPYGPDEFAIVLPETGQAGARQSVVRVRERLTSLPFEGDPRLDASRFSAGIVTYPHPAALQPDDLYDMAEAALVRGRAQSIERIGVAM